MVKPRSSMIASFASAVSTPPEPDEGALLIRRGAGGTMAVKRAGQIVLTPFPYTDLSGAKLRPVLMLRLLSYTGRDRS